MKYFHFIVKWQLNHGVFICSVDLSTLITVIHKYEWNLVTFSIRADVRYHSNHIHCCTSACCSISSWNSLRYGRLCESDMREDNWVDNYTYGVTHVREIPVRQSYTTQPLWNWIYRSRTHTRMLCQFATHMLGGHLELFLKHYKNPMILHGE